MNEAREMINKTIIISVMIFCSLIVSVNIAESRDIKSKTVEDYNTNFDTLFKSWKEFEVAISDTSLLIDNAKTWLSEDIKNYETLLFMLEHVLEIEELTGKLFFYSVLKRNINTRSNIAQSAYDRATKLKTESNSILSKMSKQIGEVESHKLVKWIKTEKRLLPFQLIINSAINTAKYRLDDQQESLLGKMERAKQLSADVWTSLAETPSIWPKNISGDTLDITEYRRLRRLPPSERRKVDMNQFLSHIGTLSKTYGL